MEKETCIYGEKNKTTPPSPTGVLKETGDKELLHFLKALSRAPLALTSSCLFPPCSRFNHPNILKQLGVCLLNEPQYIILELMEGGDLLTYLRKARMTMVGRKWGPCIGFVMQVPYNFPLSFFKFNRLQFGLLVGLQETPVERILVFSSVELGQLESWANFWHFLVI